MNIWQELQIAPTRNLREIKKAYAARLKMVRPDSDAEGFQRLRAAYEHASRLAESARDQPVVERPPERSTPSEQSASLEQSAAQPATPRPSIPVPPVVGSQQAEEPVSRSQPETLPVDVNHPSGPVAVPHQELTPSPAKLALQFCELLERTSELARPRMLRDEMEARRQDSLDFRAALQRGIQMALLRDFDRFYVLIDVFSNFYDWQKSTATVGQSDPLLQEILARQAARAWVRAIQQSRARDSQAQKAALEILRKPVDEKEARRFVRSASRRTQMTKLLQELQSTQRAAVYFETVGATVAWWIQFLPKAPASIESLIKQGAMIATFGLLAFIWLLERHFSPLEGPFVKTHPWVHLPVYLTCTLLALAGYIGMKWLAGITRAWTSPRLARLQDYWLSSMRRQRLLLVATAVSISLTALTPVSDVGWFFVLLSVALFCLLHGFVRALTVIGLVCWPLQVTISALLAPLWRMLQPFLNSETAFDVLIPVHLTASLLWIPFARLFAIVPRKLSWRVPKDPHRAAFLSAWALAGVVTAVMAYQGLPIRPLFKAPPTSDTFPPEVPISKPMTSSTSSPPTLPSTFFVPTPLRSPPQKARLARPLMEIQKYSDLHRDRFDKAFKAYTVNHPGGTDKVMKVEYTVVADGSVSDVRIVSSTFADAAFERQVVDIVRATRYTANVDYLPTNFSFRFASTKLSKP